jgi:hypothetical protein
MAISELTIWAIIKIVFTVYLSWVAVSFLTICVVLTIAYFIWKKANGF